MYMYVQIYMEDRPTELLIMWTYGIASSVVVVKVLPSHA